TLSYGAHTFLCADTIFAHGTDSHRERYLPKLISGEWIGCMGLTEPGAGSDVAVVYAKTDKDLKHAGISAFIVEKGTPGFSAGKNLVKMGVRSSHTSELVFQDCQIPQENLLGQEGAGFNMAMQTVEWDRSTIMAPFVGGMAYALKRCLAYAKERCQFGRPIAEYQAIKHKLANIKIFIEAARSLIYRIAWCKDQGRPLNHLEAAVAKLFIGDWSLGPANDAVTLHGGYGYCHEYDVERNFRDSRLAPIGGGTSEITKRIIAKLI
ncbi:MAG: acyl-CoA dehydrogenase family protein, partial [Pseudomonadota bacterium]